MRGTVLGLLCTILLQAGCATPGATGNIASGGRTLQKLSVLAERPVSPVAGMGGWDCRIVHIPETAKYCVRGDTLLSSTDNSIWFVRTEKMSNHDRFGNVPVYVADATMWLPPTAGDTQRAACERGTNRYYSDWNTTDKVLEPCVGLYPES